jgi:hypothetical protein
LLYSWISQAAGTTHNTPAPTPASTDDTFDSKRTRLISAIRALKSEAPNWSGEQRTVNAGSALTAEKFLQCLSSQHRLPKIAADGEGDVMLVWDDPKNSCIVTIEPRTLHMVLHPGTPQAKQIDAIQFLGLRIPPNILGHLPLK